MEENFGSKKIWQMDLTACRVGEKNFGEWTLLQNIFLQIVQSWQKKL